MMPQVKAPMSSRDKILADFKILCATCSKVDIDGDPAVLGERLEG